MALAPRISQSPGTVAARPGSAPFGHLNKQPLRLAAGGLYLAAAALLLRLLCGVGFANYDTLYALVWGRELAAGQGAQYDIPIAPTPHPLMELVGALTSPFGPHTAEQVAVWVGYLALAACGLFLYLLFAPRFGRLAGLIGALIIYTRTPILSYGVRAYIDLPFLALMLAALALETRRPRAGWPVLALLALGGLLRPEAWVFSGLYWLYLALWDRLQLRLEGRRPTLVRPAPGRARQRRGAGALGLLFLFVAAPPLIWSLSDLLITGNGLWSLTHTKETAATLDRATGLLKAPEYVPRRIGEILRPAELAGAAVGGILCLRYRPRPSALPALAGVVAVAVFVALAGFGLPIDTRYAFLSAAILAGFCGAGVAGWQGLAQHHPARRWWAVVGLLLLAGLLATAPGQYDEVSGQLRNLAHQERIQQRLVRLVEDHPGVRSCLPLGLPNHAPIPLLALYLEVGPRAIVSAQVREISHGTYIEAANDFVRRAYILDPHEPHPLAVHVPPGFTYRAGNRDWLLFSRCQPVPKRGG